MKAIVLASNSPRRKELLGQMGLTFRAQPSDIEEITTKTLPQDVVMELSKQKALDVARKVTSNCVVIGSDTVVAVDSEILGKPKDVNDAKRMILKLSGRSHFVYTGVTVLEVCNHKIEKEQTFYECAKVSIAKMSSEEIDAYIATKEPMDKAGAYAIQGRFAPFVERIEGDYYTIVGIPVAHLYQTLKQFSAI